MRAYLRRWAVEDANRVGKQGFGLERIRGTDWRRVRRLVRLVGIAYGFSGLINRRAERVVKGWAELARPLRPPQKVIACAVRRGIASVWAAGLLKDLHSVLDDFQHFLFVDICSLQYIMRLASSVFRLYRSIFVALPLTWASESLTFVSLTFVPGDPVSGVASSP